MPKPYARTCRLIAVIVICRATFASATLTQAGGPLAEESDMPEEAALAARNVSRPREGRAGADVGRVGGGRPREAGGCWATRCVVSLARGCPPRWCVRED